jgi:hypothetical protein
MPARSRLLGLLVQEKPRRYLQPIGDLGVRLVANWVFQTPRSTLARSSLELVRASVNLDGNSRH